MSMETERTKSGGTDMSMETGRTKSGGTDMSMETGRTKSGGTDMSMETGRTKSGGTDMGMETERTKSGGTDMGIETEGTGTIGKDKSRTIQTRRVGTVTFGLTLICFGVMFLIHIAVPALRYDIIFRLWPFVFILLGMEILVENHRSGRRDYKFVYDFPAVIMLALVLFFAMLMAAVDYAVTHGGVL